MSNSFAHTLNDRFCNLLLDYREDVRESEIAFDRLVVCLKQFHHPLESRLQKIKAIQQGCMQTLYMNGPLFGEVRDILYDPEILEMTDYPVHGVHDFTCDNKQPLYDFCEMLVNVESITDGIRSQLDIILSELNLLSDELEDSISTISDLNDELESKVCECYDCMAEEIDYLS